MITANQLNYRLGQSISKICPNGYASAADNHCAHYVSHVLNFTFGVTCGQMHSGPGPNANIRVQELFARCPSVGVWVDRPVEALQSLVFVTNAANVNLASHTMENVPKKHVGIYFNGSIWHYSNSHSQVVTTTPAQFQHHYPGLGIALFYGTMPH